MKRIKRTWVCNKCNDCDCTISRNSKAKDKNDFDPPGMVKRHQCLVALSFRDAEWKEVDEEKKP